TIIEMADQILPTALGKNMARILENQLIENDVKVLLSQTVIQINGDKETGVESVVTSKGTIPCDLVVLSVGIRPNTKFASDAGLAIGSSGALLVDRRMRTTDPDIYAGGDCIELRNLVSGENMTMPLGSLANRQGRIIATNINGGNSHFKGTVGTFCVKVFEMGVATAGLTSTQAKATGFDPVHSIVVQHDRAHFYPTAQLMYIKLIADKKSRQILGIEAVGAQGDAAKARVDAVAPLLAGGIEIDDICNLETGYAPPFASAMDIINNAGNTLDNIFQDRNRPIDVIDFIEEFRQGRIKVLDVRDAKEVKPLVEKYGDNKWINIPQAELRERIGEVPKDEPLCLLCNTGPRSYEAQILLENSGIFNTRNIQGGYGMILVIDKEFIS
ncbi:MAG: FAD-dependent oxidoreductase, partial [Desulfobacteraceae bacterium]|nr:FAD-dependent oxidoreductase [Desulfobacteraceae bacterium]